jgi:hypothetical protein
VRRLTVEQFWAKVDVRGPEECWEWKRRRSHRGYGETRWGGKTERANRRAWLLVNGPIPIGVSVLHHCDNPPCCNPAHLFLGTHTDNMRDMAAKGRTAGQSKTHCPQGHPYAGDNLLVRPNSSGRWCRTCVRASNRRSGERRRERRRVKASLLTGGAVIKDGRDLREGSCA